jgi:hypothetical protein
MIEAREIDGELWIKASDHHRAIAELKSQEPVAFLANAMRFKLSFDSEGKVNCFWNQKELGGRWVALVAAEDDCHLKLTHPPQRTWVGLTDEEIDKTHETQVWDARRSYARAIEAKLKQKNGFAEEKNT